MLFEYSKSSFSIFRPLGGHRLFLAEVNGKMLEIALITHPRGNVRYHFEKEGRVECYRQKYFALPACCSRTRPSLIREKAQTRVGEFAIPWSDVAGVRRIAVLHHFPESITSVARGGSAFWSGDSVIDSIKDFDYTDFFLELNG